MESLPLVLLLGAMLAASAAAIGSNALNRVQRLTSEQRAINSFNNFVEQCQMLCAGGVGDSKVVELDLGEGKIALRGNLVQLLVGKTVKGFLLPLSVSAASDELYSGTYVLKVYRRADGLFLIKVEGI